MGADDQLLDEVAAMYEGLRRARQTMELWLRVAKEDPAAPDAEAIIRRLIRDVSEVLAPIEHRGSTRYVPPDPDDDAATPPIAVSSPPQGERSAPRESYVPDPRLTSVA